MSAYYEAVCGKCGAVIYCAERGVVTLNVKCPQCAEENHFSSAMLLRDGDPTIPLEYASRRIVGKLAVQPLTTAG